MRLCFRLSSVLRTSDGVSCLAEMLETAPGRSYARHALQVPYRHPSSFQYPGRCAALLSEGQIPTYHCISIVILQHIRTSFSLQSPSLIATQAALHVSVSRSHGIRYTDARRTSTSYSPTHNQCIFVSRARRGGEVGTGIRNHLVTSYAPPPRTRLSHPTLQRCAGRSWPFGSLLLQACVCFTAEPYGIRFAEMIPVQKAIPPDCATKCMLTTLPR
jgi:hypothetical protein